MRSTRMTGRDSQYFKRSAPEAPHKRYSRRSVWMMNGVLVGVASALMYLLFPHFMQKVVYDGLLRHGLPLFPEIILAWLAYRYNHIHDIAGIKKDLKEHRRAIAAALTLLIAGAVWSSLVHTMADYLTYKMYASGFAARSGLIASAPAFVRFTPLQNASTDIGNSVSITGQHIDAAHVQPIITKNGFGYVAPITPSGWINTIVMSNPGFLFLNDSFAADSNPQKRLTRIDDKQYYGLGMELFDNIYYKLAHTEFFTDFDTPHYLALDPNDPRKLTMVVPKVKYTLLFQVPYWGGIIVVHSDGTVENLSAQEAVEDSRFAGQWIYPTSLVRTYVQVQNYAAGWGILTPYVKVAGKLEIEELPGINKFPLLTHGVDGKPYLVTAVKGQGAARGIFRMYFTDASNGNSTYYEFGSHETVYGPGAALERLTNIPGYQWYHGRVAGGTMIAVEPVYIVRPNDSTLYWKFTITNVNFSGISATVMSNASRPDHMLPFVHRSEFEEWLHGREAASSDIREPLLRKIEEIKRQLENLKHQVHGLPH